MGAFSSNNRLDGHSNRNNYNEVEYSNGDRYEGQFKDNRRDGYGVYISSNGERYEGNFKKGQRDGKGKYIFKNGEIYEGYYRKDMREGQGKYIFNDGSYVVGTFSKNEINGKGKIVSVHNVEYHGSWSNGVFKSGQIYRQPYISEVDNTEVVPQPINVVFDDNGEEDMLFQTSTEDATKWIVDEIQHNEIQHINNKYGFSKN